MASPTLQSTNENHTSPAKPTTTQHNASVNRRVLGEVSPNVKVAAQTPAFLSQALAGSPLKRSFTAAMEGGEGLMYLKRRKLSGDEVMSQIDGSYDRSIRNENATSRLGEGEYRSIWREGEDMSVHHPLHTFESDGPTTLQIETAIPSIIEASPTEPNTPSSSQSSTPDSTEERKSFSSLIHYDPSSQTCTSIFKTPSQAEMLRLRLRVAMYKVRTNQISTPFQDIEAEASERAAPIDISAATREAVEQLRREALEIAARDRTIASALLEAPVLLPTAYSSRMIYDTHLPTSPSGVEEGDGLPVGPVDVDADVGVATPCRGFESPETGRRRLARPSEQELTSSVVKGRVAEGLLGLRHAV